MRMPVGRFLAHAERLAQVRPPELALTHVAEHWYDLFTHPQLPCVTRIQLYTPQPWGGPTSWSLAEGVVRQMGELGRGNRIRGLDLSRCRVGDGGGYCLAEHADGWQLEDLDLSHNDIEFGGLLELLLSSIPQTLRRVNLCDNPLNDLAAKALVERWPSPDTLKWIRLERTSISPAGRQLLRDRFGEKVEFEQPSPYG